MHLILYEDFLRELQFARAYSVHTISAYKKDLEYYKDFRKTSKPIQDFYKFLTKKKLSSRSQVRVVSCIRTYFKFLELRGHPYSDIKYLKFPNIKNKLPKLISMKEFEALCLACEEKTFSFSVRNKLILTLLYGLGCRVSELISLDLKDFNETESWLSLIGKGSKQRLLPLSSDLYKLLNIYLNEARPLIGKTKTAPLFFNNRRRRPSRVDIWRWLKAWSLKAGFSDVKNPHSFRHGCATSLLEKGADLRTIQKLLGHSSIQTTQIYTSVSTKKLKEAVDNYHPLSKVKES